MAAKRTQKGKKAYKKVLPMQQPIQSFLKKSPEYSREKRPIHLPSHLKLDMEANWSINNQHVPQYHYPQIEVLEKQSTFFNNISIE